MPLPLGPAEPGPAPARRWGRLAAAFAAILLLLAGAAGVVIWRASRSQAAGAAPTALGPDLTADSLARAPAGVRVKVQVVNATKTRGLARRATQALRDRGYDVVEVGTTAALRDSTVVFDRAGHPDWARRLARAMGGARVEARPDSSHYLDLTVLVGRSWRPPAEPFYP